MLLLESQNWEKATEKKNNAEKMFQLAPMVNSSGWTD
jgi:hypothetical protein